MAGDVIQETLICALTEYAKEAFELSKMQESTRQIETQKGLKEMEGQIEQLKIEQTR